MYEAWLSDTDVETAAHLDAVFEITPFGAPEPSAERPAQLVARTGTGATLPAVNSPTYIAWLLQKGLGVTTHPIASITARSVSSTLGSITVLLRMRTLIRISSTCT